VTQADLEQTLAAREKLIHEQEQRISRLEAAKEKMANAAAGLYQLSEDMERILVDLNDPKYALALKQLHRAKAKYRAQIR
jgi:hypothetical protein